MYSHILKLCPLPPAVIVLTLLTVHKANISLIGTPDEFMTQLYVHVKNNLLTVTQARLLWLRKNLTVLYMKIKIIMIIYNYQGQVKKKKKLSCF